MKRYIKCALLFVLLLSTLACGISDAVRKVAEPVDKSVCQADCAREGLDFLSYDYEDHRCKGTDVDGNEITLYEWREEAER